MRLTPFGVVAALWAGAAPLGAQAPLAGDFVAQKSCPAVQSIRKGTNPGNAEVAPGRRYRLLGKNKDAATHYRIAVEGAAPPERWVAVECGSVEGEAAGSVLPAPQRGAGDRLYVLALSWEPAFCEEMPDKLECRSQTTTRHDATHLSLHGLWPQPRRIAYCGVDAAIRAAGEAHRWADLPAPELSAALRARLEQAMPGTQSLLERHEWAKHGTCYLSGAAETYFADALRLTEAVNTSAVQALLAQRIGKPLTGVDLRVAFDQAFGTGAGRRVRIACTRDGSRQLIAEITIGLKGDISAGTSLADLIQAAVPTDPGCPAGIVDPIGAQ